MKLTQEQLDFFDAFGYLMIIQLFSSDEMARITQWFEWSMHNCGEGKNHDGSTRTMILGPIEHHPEMCRLLDHPAILGLIGGVLGEDFNYCSGDGNYFAHGIEWHTDGGCGELGKVFATKTSIYLDPLTRDTGALRVIPGSHRPDHYVRREKIDLNKSMEQYGVPPSEFPGNVALETNPGDVIIFNHDLYHAAFGGGTRRRMFDMNCTHQAKTPEDMRRVEAYVSYHSPGGYKSRGYKLKPSTGMYYPAMIDTADESRWVHLHQPAMIHDQMYSELAK